MAGSSEYWKKREKEAKAATLKDEVEYKARIEKIYNQTIESIERQVNDWYARYANDNNMTMAEARAKVRKLDMERYERLAAKYVATRDFSDEANEEMKIYNLTMRINRLELLKAQINLELLAGYDDIQNEMERDLIETAMKEDRRLAGILGDSVIGNQHYARVLVNASFQNATFSERLWGNNMPKLRARLETELRNGLIQGIHPRELARRFRSTFGGSIRDTERLMVTEMRRLQTDVQKESFERNGFTEYRFITTGDERVCPECEKLNGQHFKVSEMQPGENAPPMHPSCRCSTAAYMDSDKYKRWIDALERGEDVRWKEFEADKDKEHDSEKNLHRKPVLMNDETSGNSKTHSPEELFNMCHEANSIVWNYTDIPTNWKGIVNILTSDEMKDVPARKEWDCSISVNEKTTLKNCIHEQLHARSGSKAGEDLFRIFRPLEEGTVELFTQEICKDRKISYSRSYKKYVKPLRIIQSMCNICQTDLEFAKILFEKPLNQRYNFLKEYVDAYLNGNHRLSNKEQIKKALHQLIQKNENGGLLY